MGWLGKEGNGMDGQVLSYRVLYIINFGILTVVVVCMGHDAFLTLLNYTLVLHLFAFPDHES